MVPECQTILIFAAARGDEDGDVNCS